MTSPARPWFRLAVADAKLLKSSKVRAWLDDVGVLMREVFARSNAYRAMHSMYKELGGFGTAACIILPDFEKISKFFSISGGYTIPDEFGVFSETFVFGSDE